MISFNLYYFEDIDDYGTDFAFLGNFHSQEKATETMYESFEKIKQKILLKTNEPMYGYNNNNKDTCLVIYSGEDNFISADNSIIFIKTDDYCYIQYYADNYEWSISKLI